MNKYRNLPVGFIGTVLGLATLSNAYNAIGFSFIRTIVMIFALYCWTIAARKVFLNFDKVKEEYMENTVTATLYATFSMLTMVLSSFIVQFIAPLGKVLWLIAIFVQLTLIILLFVKHIFVKQNIDVILPSWYVTFLGLLVSTAVGTEMGFDYFQHIIVLIGYGLYFTTIGFVVYRLSKKDLPAPARFTKTILLAPISLIIVGTLNVYTNFSADHPGLIYFLYIIFIITMIYVLKQTKSFLKGGFVPGYAALTFPHAIACIASLKVSGFLVKQNLVTLGNLVHYIAIIQIIVTTVIILYTLTNFFKTKESWN